MKIRNIHKNIRDETIKELESSNKRMKETIKLTNKERDDLEVVIKGFNKDIENMNSKILLNDLQIEFLKQIIEE